MTATAPRRTFRSAAEPPSVSAAQACVDEARVQEHAVSAGPQVPPYRLNCPLGPAPPQTAWLKGCRQLPAEYGKPYLEFSSVSLEDRGNYTCVLQGDSTASFTLRLTVEGTYGCAVPPYPFLLGVKGESQTAVTAVVFWQSGCAPKRRCLNPTGTRPPSRETRAPR